MLGYLAVVADAVVQPLTEEAKSPGALVLYYASNEDRVPEGCRARAITDLEGSFLG